MKILNYHFYKFKSHTQTCYQSFNIDAPIIMNKIHVKLFTMKLYDSKQENFKLTYV